MCQHQQIKSNKDWSLIRADSREAAWTKQGVSMLKFCSTTVSDSIQTAKLLQLVVPLLLQTVALLGIT